MILGCFVIALPDLQPASRRHAAVNAKTPRRSESEPRINELGKGRTSSADLTHQLDEERQLLANLQAAKFSLVITLTITKYCEITKTVTKTEKNKLNY